MVSGLSLFAGLALLLGGTPASAQVLGRFGSGASRAPFVSMAAPSALASPASPSLIPALPVLPALTPISAAPHISAGLAPSARPAGAAIRAYVLDLDGNAFGPGFPTKIILFEKGSARELAVSTARFALLEKSIGKDFPYEGVNLKDYELRGDASFREFFGPKFAADLKYAVENLPASEWQGPSWPALLEALNDPGIAPFVYVLTARQHSSEHLLDGFRYLQAAGFIKYLPKAENLHGVGGTHRTAERKAELMVKFLDALQAAPFGLDGGPHTIGFSDDTWANYEKMRDALGAVLSREPDRWSKVRITLFFTGEGDPDHAPQRLVLAPL